MSAPHPPAGDAFGARAIGLGCAVIVLFALIGAFAGGDRGPDPDLMALAMLATLVAVVSFAHGDDRQMCDQRQAQGKR